MRGKPGVGLAVGVAGMGTSGPEFEPLSAVEITPSGVDSTFRGW